MIFSRKRTQRNLCVEIICPIIYFVQSRKAKNVQHRILVLFCFILYLFVRIFLTYLKLHFSALLVILHLVFMHNFTNFTTGTKAKNFIKNRSKSFCMPKKEILHQDSRIKFWKVSIILLKKTKDFHIIRISGSPVLHKFLPAFPHLLILYRIPKTSHFPSLLTNKTFSTLHSHKSPLL